MDPGTQGVPATDDGWDARDLHTGVELVLGVNEPRQESVDLATIDDLVPSAHYLEVALRHRAMISPGRQPESTANGAQRSRRW
jgi:tRNA U54 and U55 pseudouridine synthase Pus10